MAAVNRKMLMFVLMATLIPMPSTCNSLNVDLVVLLYYGVHYWKATLNSAVRPLAQRLPTMFNFGDDKTRVALVASANGRRETHVYAPLTGNATALAIALDSLKDLYAYQQVLDLKPMLEKVGQELFNGQPTRPRIIFVMTHNHRLQKQEEEAAQLTDEALNEAKKLRDAGVLIYAASEVGDGTVFNGWFDRLCGNATYHHQVTSIINDLNENALMAMKEKITKHFCAYEGKCFYTDQSRSKCEKGFYTPKVPLSVGDCSTLGVPPPTTNEACQPDECDKECDALWPLSNAPTCTECGQSVDLVRSGPMRWKELQFCPVKKMCSTCPPPTVAPVTVAPNTIAPVTDAPTTGAPATVAPNTVAPVTGAPATSAPATVAPPAAAPASKVSLPVIIGVSVSVVSFVILIAIVIVAVILCVSKRKKAAEQSVKKSAAKKSVKKSISGKKKGVGLKKKSADDDVEAGDDESTGKIKSMTTMPEKKGKAASKKK